MCYTRAKLTTPARALRAPHSSHLQAEAPVGTLALLEALKKCGHRELEPLSGSIIIGIVAAVGPQAITDGWRAQAPGNHALLLAAQGMEDQAVVRLHRLHCLHRLHRLRCVHGLHLGHGLERRRGSAFQLHDSYA